MLERTTSSLGPPFSCSSSAFSLSRSSCHFVVVVVVVADGGGGGGHALSAK